MRSFPIEPVRLALALSAIVVTSIFTTGCFETAKETLDPDLGIRVERVYVKNVTDDGKRPLSGRSWTYLDVNVSNFNEKAQVPITSTQFFARDSEGHWHWCRGSEQGEDRNVKPGEHLLLSIYFETGANDDLVYLEYRRTVSDPISCSVP